MEKTPHNPSKAKEESLPKLSADLQASRELNSHYLDLPTSSTYTEGIKQAPIPRIVDWIYIGSRKYCHWILNMTSEDDFNEDLLCWKYPTRLGSNTTWAGGTRLYGPYSFISTSPRSKSAENANFTLIRCWYGYAGKSSWLWWVQSINWRRSKKKPQMNKRYENTLPLKLGWPIVPSWFRSIQMELLQSFVRLCHTLQPLLDQATRSILQL